MEDLKKLQEMAKNGEISEKLLSDEDFKSKLKEILKEEKGIDIKDEQIPEIIKNFEAALQDDKILEEAELETVSGGGIKEIEGSIYKRKHKRIRNIFSCSGMILGTLCVAPSIYRAGDKVAEGAPDLKTKAKDIGGAGVDLVKSAALGVGVGTITAKLGDLIADKLVERDMRKDGVIKSNR